MDEYECVCDICSESGRAAAAGSAGVLASHSHQPHGRGDRAQSRQR